MPSHLISRRRPLLLAFVALVAGLAAAAVTIVGHANAAASDPHEQFQILNSKASADDPALFDSAVARRMAELNDGGAPDVGAARTRSIRGNDGSLTKISVTTAPGGRVCLAHRDTADADSPLFINCAAVADSVQHGLVSVTHAAPGPGVDPAVAEVTALVPNGVESVTFDLADGTQESAKVTANTVSLELKHPTSMTFVDGSETHTTKFGG